MKLVKVLRNVDKNGKFNYAISEKNNIVQK